MIELANKPSKTHPHTSPHRFASAGTSRADESLATRLDKAMNENKLLRAENRILWDLLISPTSDTLFAV